jgi:phosphoribosylformimino-5-aminoimidazole carboxamide ribotide isomerase
VILYPAIDPPPPPPPPPLKEGRCVRLVQGDMAQAKVFNDDPAAQAEAFEMQGFSWLHVVDLDGAFAGAPRNAAAVDAILARIKLPVQLGGGVREMRTLEGWLEKGVSRVIIGTAAVRDPAFVHEAARRHPGRIAVGIDAKDGRVAVEGWAQTSSMTAEELGRRFEDAGVAAIIYTDIARDGILKGLNIEMTLALASARQNPRHRLGAASPRWRMSSASWNPIAPCSPAPSPGAPSTTGASIRRRRWPRSPAPREAPHDRQAATAGPVSLKASERAQDPHHPPAST